MSETDDFSELKQEVKSINKLLGEILVSTSVVGEKIKTIDSVGERLEAVQDRLASIERYQSHRDGSVAGIYKTVGLVSVFTVALITWLFNTTWSNNKDIATLQQRMTNIEAKVDKHND